MSAKNLTREFLNSHFCCEVLPPKKNGEEVDLSQGFGSARTSLVYRLEQRIYVVQNVKDPDFAAELALKALERFV